MVGSCNRLKNMFLLLSSSELLLVFFDLLNEDLILDYINELTSGLRIFIADVSPRCDSFSSQIIELRIVCIEHILGVNQLNSETPENSLLKVVVTAF